MASVAQFWFGLVWFAVPEILPFIFHSLWALNGTDPSEAAAYSEIFKRKPCLPFMLGVFFFFVWL